MSGKIKVKATLETKTAGRVASTGLLSAAKLLARKTFSLGKGIVNTLGVKTTILTAAALATAGSYKFVDGANTKIDAAIATVSDFVGNTGTATGPQTTPIPTGIYKYLPTEVTDFIRDNANDTARQAVQVASLGALAYGAFSLAKDATGAYASTDLYKESKLEVKKDAKHYKKVAEKLAEIQQSKNNGGPGLSNDGEFMKSAIYLDLSLFKQLDPQLLNSDQFLKDVAEGATAAGVSSENKRALVKYILEKQPILNSNAPVQTKREFLESLGAASPELLPLIASKYSNSIRGDKEALSALLKLALPAQDATKQEALEANKIQVATTKAILKVADRQIVDRAFLLELGQISRDAMKHVLFPLLEDDEIVANDHLNYMLAKAEKDPRGAFNEAQFLQNTPAFMAAVCASDPTMLSSCSERLLKTPAFLADLFDRNPQSVKEVLKTSQFKKILEKNNRRLPKDLLKKILIFSYEAKFVDSITGVLPKMSESLLASLAGKTPSLLKTKLLQNRGLPTKPAFAKAVIRKNPGVLSELPRSIKTKKLFEELCSEIRPFSNLRRLAKGKMLKHNKLVAEMAKDPETAFLVGPDGILSNKIDFHIANRAKRVVVDHRKGTFESRERTYLDILEADPEFIKKIPPSNSEEEWEKFIVKAATINPMVIPHLSPAIVTKLEATSSNFVLAQFDGRIESAEEFLSRLGGNPATAHLMSDKNFKAELAKKARVALRTVLSDEDKLDANLLREYDHKHKLGKGVYTYGAWSVDKRGGWYNPIRHMRATLPQLGDRIKATANEWIFNKFEHGPIDYMLRFRVENYSNVSDKKFERYDARG